MPADHGDRAAAADAGGENRFEPLLVERDLEVVAHAAVDADEGLGALFDRGHAIDGRRGRGDHAASRLDEDPRGAGQVLARRADQPVEVLLQRGRVVRERVAHPQAAAEVVHVELAEGRHRGNGGRQLAGVHDLRPDMGVHARHPQPRAGLDSRDGRPGVRRGQTELRAFVPRRHGGVRNRLDARDDPDQAALPGIAGHRPLEPVDVVEVVHRDVADALGDGHLDLFGRLRVAVQDNPGGVRAGRPGGDDLTAAGDVQAQPFLHQDPLHGGAGERLRREEHL
jgi:hypothetical protein